MTLGNKSLIFNGSGLDDIFCFVPQQTNSEITVIFLIGIFLIIFIVLTKARYPKDLSFMSASITAFTFSLILLLAQNALACALISERAFIISLVLMIGSIIVYKYNEGSSQ